MTKFELYDISDEPETILDLAFSASLSDHRNAKNYHPKVFEKRLPNYIRFYVVKWKDTPVAFSGIYRDPSWPYDTARIGDRNYYFPIARSKTLGFTATTGFTAFNSRFLSPTQTTWCLSRNITKPFLSVQEINRRPALKKILEYQKTLNNYNYQLLDDMYFTCPPHEECKQDPACWQSIISLDGQKLELPSKTIAELINDFK
jgi:hypothetical protein